VKGNGKGKGIVTQTEGGEDISCAVALTLQNGMDEPDLDTEGKHERVLLEMEASPAVSIASDDDTDSIEESDSDYDLELNSDVDMHLEDNVEAPDDMNLDWDLDMGMDGDDEKEEDEEEHAEEVEDEDEDDGNEPETIGQGEMVIISADDVDSMVDDDPILHSEQGQEMCEHTPQQQPTASAPEPQTPGPHP
jgi:hypothetical protein